MKNIGLTLCEVLRGRGGVRRYNFDSYSVELCWIIWQNILTFMFLRKQYIKSGRPWGKGKILLLMKS
jgi:hypothetical protein